MTPRSPRPRTRSIRRGHPAAGSGRYVRSPIEVLPKYEDGEVEILLNKMRSIAGDLLSVENFATNHRIHPVVPPDLVPATHLVCLLCSCVQIVRGSICHSE